MYGRRFPFTAGQGLKWVEDDAAVNPESMFAIKYNKLASWSTTIGYGNGYALHLVYVAMIRPILSPSDKDGVPVL